MDTKEFKELEDNSKYEVIKLAEDNKDDSKKQKIIDNLSSEVDKLFQNAKKVANDAKDNEQIQQSYKRAKEEVSKLIERSKNALQNFGEDDRVQDVWENITSGFDKVVTDLSKNETVVSVGKKVDEIVNSDTVQDGITNVKNFFTKKKKDSEK